MKRFFKFNEPVCNTNRKERGNVNHASFSRIHVFLCCETSFFKVINRLENLSNEIFHEIFDYLDGYDLLNAFSHLNVRFQNLINHSSISLKLLHDNRKSIPMKLYCNEVILPNKHRILALHAMFNWDHGLCFDCSIFDIAFERLESLTLAKLTTDQLPINCIYLMQLPRLYSLQVYLEAEPNNFRNFNMIYQEILRLPVLKRLMFFSPLKWIEDRTVVVIPSIINPKASSIEDLYIRQIISPSNVLSVLEHTPQLCHLYCSELRESNVTTHQLKKMNLGCLKQISIEDCWIPFNRFEVLMHSIGEQLEILQFNRHGDTDCLNSDRWEQMIRNEMPRLKVFDMLCENILRTLIDSSDDLITSFYSQFWIERGWFSSVFLDQHWMKIHIHPYK